MVDRFLKTHDEKMRARERDDDIARWREEQDTPSLRERYVDDIVRSRVDPNDERARSEVIYNRLDMEARERAEEMKASLRELCERHLNRILETNE